MLQIADIDEIYTFGKCVNVEYAQNPNDEFDVYEFWNYKNLIYKIGRAYTESEGRTSIIIDVNKGE